MAEHQKSKLVRVTTFLLFGFLVLSFGLWGIGDIFRGGGHTQVVATVGDQEITRQTYDRALEQEIRSTQESVGSRLTRDQLMALNVPQRALAPLIQQALLTQLAADRGLVVSEVQLLKAIAREPSFQVNGTFSKEAYQQALRNANMSEGQFLALLSLDVARESMFDPLTEAVAIPDPTARLLFGYLAETRTAQFVVVDAAGITDLPAASEEELKQTYQDYAAQFQAPEYRAVTLLHLSAKDFYGEVTVSEDEARQRYEATKDSFDQPEKRGLRQIVYDDQASAEAALAELATGKTLDEVAAEKGTSVAEIAPQTQKQLGAVLPGLADAAFGLPADERYGVAETLLGWHLFEVASIEPPKTSSFEEVKDKVTQQLRDERANETLSSIAAQMTEEFNTGATLDEVSQKLSFPLTKIEAIDREGKDRAGNYIDGLPSPPQLLPLLFEGNDTGVDSLLNQAQDGSYFAYRVDSITPPAPRPYEEVADQVKTLWERLARDRLAKEKAEALAKEIGDKSKTLDQIATENGWTVETSKPMTRFAAKPDETPSPSLPAKLFAAQVGDAVTASADEGTVLAVLTEVTQVKADDDAERFGNLQASYRRALSAEMGQQMTLALQQEYPVEINQKALDESLAGY